MTRITSSIVSIATTVTVDGVVYHAEHATIDSTHLGFNDRGMFVAMLDMSYHDSWVQTVGTYCLGAASTDAHDLSPTKAGCEWIMRVLEVFGDGARWEKLKGQRVLVLFDKPFTNNAQPVGLAPIDRDGKLFLFPPWQTLGHCCLSIPRLHNHRH